MTTTTRDPHPLADQTVVLPDHVSKTGAGPIRPGAEYVVEDWWDRLTGGSWMDANGNPAAMSYALRAGMVGLPLDNQVVYGHIGGIGHLLHVTELATEGTDRG